MAAQTTSKAKATETKGTEAETKVTPPDPDAKERARWIESMLGIGATQAEAEAFAEKKISVLRAEREAEALKARRAEREKQAFKALGQEAAKRILALLTEGYDLDGEEIVILRREKNEAGDFKEALSLELVSPVGRKASVSGGGGGVARSGEQWRVAGPGIDEVLGSPSTAAMKVQEKVNGKSSATNGRAWWGIPQEAPVGHKVTKTYHGSIYTIERVG